MVTFHASPAFTHLHPPPLPLSFFLLLSASGCLWILKLKSILETCHQHIIYFSQGQEDLLLCTSSSLFRRSKLPGINHSALQIQTNSPFLSVRLSSPLPPLRPRIDSSSFTHLSFDYTR